MSSLKNTIRWQKKLKQQKQRAINRGNMNSSRKYNNLIQKYEGLIKNKRHLDEKATLAQLEKDAAASVNALQAPNNISPAMKQQLHEFQKHAFRSKP